MEEGFRAGAARCRIDLGGVLAFDGFTGIHDPLQVRVAILANGSTQLALAVLDLVSMPADLVEQSRETIAAAAAISPERVVVCATHTFGSPHALPLNGTGGGEDERSQAFRTAVLVAAGEAAAGARRGLRPARLGHGHGVSGVNVNREVSTSDGWWLGLNESGVRDPGVGVVRVEDLDGSPIAILVNYSVQSSVMHHSVTRTGGRLVTADLAGATARHVEAQYPGADPVVLFLIGCAADQGPALSANRGVIQVGAHRHPDIHEDGFLLVDLLGERLGHEVVRVSGEIRATDSNPTLQMLDLTLTLPAQIAPRDFRALRPSTSYEFVSNGHAPAPVVIARIGDVAFVGVQVELSCTTGLALKRLSPFPLTLVANLVNGGAKYMVAESGYERITYGAMNSQYARGAAELLTQDVARMLADLAPAVL